VTARDVLRLYRAQTAAVEGAGFPLAAWLGHAPLWSLPGFALLGLLAHFGGFGENSFLDYLAGFDKSDPSKADHPLVAGRMTVGHAGAWVYLAQVAGVLVFVTLLFHGVRALPVLAFAGYIGLGHAYNLVGKRNKPLAVAEISGAFALAFLACGSLWTGAADPVVWAAAAYAGVFTAFQIAVAGELKELAQPGERNLLRRLGSRVEPGMGGSAADPRGIAIEPHLDVGPGTWVLATVLTGAKWIALGILLVLLWPGFWWYPAFVVAGVALYVYGRALLRPGPFRRPRRVAVMGAGEAASYLLLVLAVAPAIWPWLVWAFAALPVVWFAGMNRLLWPGSGSALAPGV
jgi:hypothetical protein